MAIVDLDQGTVFVGGAGSDHRTPEELLLRLANRHGLIAGATGTGKTVTLQTLAESFSAAGVPVVLADVKGDLAGIAAAGSAAAPTNEAFQTRAQTIGMTLEYRAFPATFWDIFGEKGHPIRTTPAEMGPLLLSRLLNLTDVQEGVLNIAFRVADEEGLLLLDMDDLRAMLIWVGENADDLSLRYGNVAKASVGAIQRALMVLEEQGGRALFGEPALELADMIRTDASGRGMVNVLAADKLMNSPRLYATFLLWLLSELFEQLPEVGDPQRPVVAFFFDEAHLLFDDAPDALIEKIEQVARLIRSKGVSLWFVTQNPADLPDTVLGQMGNRVQHALRAFTAKDRKALKQAAETYRPNPDFDLATAIQEVGTGEAVTSLLEKKGDPGISMRTLIRPPMSRLGPLEAAERAAIIAASNLGLKYGKALDRDSAAEMLEKRAAEAAAEAARAAPASNDEGLFDMPPQQQQPGGTGTSTSRGRRYRPQDEVEDVPRRSAQPAERQSRRSDSLATTFGKSVARSIGTRAGTMIVRGVLGGLFRGR